MIHPPQRFKKHYETNNENLAARSSDFTKLQKKFQAEALRCMLLLALHLRIPARKKSSCVILLGSRHDDDDDNPAKRGARF